MYKIVFTSDAQKSLQLLEKKAPMAVKKLKKIIRRNNRASKNRNRAS